MPGTGGQLIRTWLIQFHVPRRFENKKDASSKKSKLLPTDLNAFGQFTTLPAPPPQLWPTGWGVVGGR